MQYNVEATKFAREAAKIITRDLLEPRGLKPADVPIFAVAPEEPVINGAAGTTHFDPDHTKPIGIVVAIQHPIELAAVLAHELIHASLPWGCGDTGHECSEFRRAIREIGLDGPETATVAGEQFAEWADRALMPLLPPPPA